MTILVLPNVKGAGGDSANYKIFLWILRTVFQKKNIKTCENTTERQQIKAQDYNFSPVFVPLTGSFIATLFLVKMMRVVFLPTFVMVGWWRGGGVKVILAIKVVLPQF